MNIKKKILVGYGVVFVLMGLVIAWAITNLMTLGDATDAILSENYRSILASENMIDSLERQDSGILLLFLGDVQNGINQFRENEAVFLEWLARAKDNITIEGEAELVQAIENDYAAYRKQFSLMTELRENDLDELDPSYYQEKIFPQFAKVRRECIELLNLNEEVMYKTSVKANGVAERAVWSTAIVGTSALVIALLFSLFLAERIVRPLRRFMDASRKISSGDYAVQVPVETKDELGRLAGEFNQMANQLSRYHNMNIEQIISEKKKGEAILSSIKDGLIVFDTDFKVLTINSAARRALNLWDLEDSTLLCEDIFQESNVCNQIRETIKTGKPPVVPDEQRIITLMDKEESRHYLFSVTAIRRRDHELSGVVLLLRDVTRLKEIEKIKSEFIMAASHELRTPLASLSMSVDLLMESASEGLNKEDMELLQAAHEEVHRMKALINDLLDLSKIEAGKIDLEFEEVSVPALFSHVENVFERQMDSKGLEFNTEFEKDLPKARADANKITWVLTNLVSNALRYVKKGGHIGLSAHRRGNQLHLSVHDDGPGIPPEYQSKVFQKFVQVEGQETEGTGLGLAICKEIVRAHGGAIWVESSPGQGSTFIFTLPIVQ